MAQIQHVTTDDERLRDYVSLRDTSLRKLLETERGIYVAEGEKVVRRAVVAGHEVRSFLMAPRWVDSLEDVLASTDAPCYVLDEDVIEQLTGFHVHRGALAVLHRPALPEPAEVLADARRILVLEDLVDHTNVGAVFRTAAALGWDGVLLSPRCADPLYRRAIKVAMGAVFSLPYARLDDWHAAPDLLRDAGFTTVAMTLGDGAVPLDSVSEDGPLALVVGSEGHGLSARWEHESLVRATIPMHPDIDSLNVAASVAIAAWELRP